MSDAGICSVEACYLLVTACPLLGCLQVNNSPQICHHFLSMPVALQVCLSCVATGSALCLKTVQLQRQQRYCERDVEAQ